MRVWSTDSISARIGEGGAPAFLIGVWVGCSPRFPKCNPRSFDFAQDDSAFSAAGFVVSHPSPRNKAKDGASAGAEGAAEKLVISDESGEKAHPRLKPVLVPLALCGG